MSEYSVETNFESDDDIRDFIREVVHDSLSDGEEVILEDDANGT